MFYWIYTENECVFELVFFFQNLLRHMNYTHGSTMQSSSEWWIFSRVSNAAIPVQFSVKPIDLGSRCELTASSTPRLLHASINIELNVVFIGKGFVQIIDSRINYSEPIWPTSLHTCDSSSALKSCLFINCAALFSAQCNSLGRFPIASMYFSWDRKLNHSFTPIYTNSSIKMSQNLIWKLDEGGITSSSWILFFGSPANKVSV